MTAWDGKATFAGSGGLNSGPVALSVIHPDADSVDGLWTDQAGGTSLFSVIDETLDLDTDYIQSARVPITDVTKISLSDPTATPLQPFIVAYRYRKSVDHTRIDLLVRLLQGSTEIAAWAHTNIAQDFLTAEQTLTSAQFAAISDFTNLFIEFTAENLLAETVSWRSAVITNGGTVSAARSFLVDDLIAGLKNDGIWTKLDRLWLFAAENATQALTDIVADALATAVNSPTFTTNVGYGGFNATTYVDSNDNPTSVAGHFIQNSAHISAWAYNWTAGAATDPCLIGGYDFSEIAEILWNTPTDIFYSINDLNVTPFGSFAPAAGFYTNSRTTSVGKSLFKNGSVNATDTTTNSISVLNGKIGIGARLDAGSINAATYMTGTLSATSIGGGLSAADVLNFYNRLSDFMGGAFADGWARSVVSNGGTVSSARQTLVGNLIAGLIRDGIWNKLDRLWLFAAENATQALTDIVASTLATAVNTPTFTIDAGYTGNGSTSYIDSNFSPNSGTPHYTQNSCCNFAWNNAAGDTKILLATIAGDTRVRIDFEAGSTFWGCQQTQHQLVSPATIGLYLGNRISSTAATLDTNGAQVDSDATASSPLGAGDISFLADALSVYGTSQISCGGAGGSLTGTDRTNFYARISDFMGAVFADGWARQVVINGGTVSATRQALVADLIAGLMRDGVWSKLDRLWLFAAENTQSALTDIVGKNLATAVNNPAFSADGGFTGDGTGAGPYIDSGFNPTLGSPNFTQNSACFFAWSNTAGTDSGALCGYPVASSVATLSIFPKFTDNNMYVAINTNSGTINVQTGADGATGLYLTNRTASNAYTVDKNGVQIGSTFTDTSSAPANANFVALEAFGGGSVSTLRQCSCFGFGGALSAGDRTNLYSRLRAYMTAVMGAETDTDVIAWISAVTANGGNVSNTRRKDVHNLVRGLKADGVWYKLDRLWLLAAENAQAALTDLVNRTLATAVNTPTFTSDRGYTGDGATNYINSNFNASTSGVTYVLNSSHISAWKTTATGSTHVLTGNFSAGFTELFVNLAFGATDLFLDQGAAGSAQVADTTIGYYLGTRTGASATRLDKNGSQVATSVQASTSIPNNNIFILARNANGSPDQYADEQVAAASMGGALTTTDSSNLYTRLRTYMTAIGVS